MPKKLERKLRKIAQKRGYSQERSNRYVYGTITKLRQKTRRRK